MANLLLVEDDDVILKTVHAALVKKGHTVMTAIEMPVPMEIVGISEEGVQILSYLALTVIQR